MIGKRQGCLLYKVCGHSAARTHGHTNLAILTAKAMDSSATVLIEKPMVPLGGWIWCMI